MLSAGHLQTLQLRDGLAGACQAAGRLGEAIPLHEQNLADSVRLLGGGAPWGR